MMKAAACELYEAGSKDVTKVCTLKDALALEFIYCLCLVFCSFLAKALEVA